MSINPNAKQSMRTNESVIRKVRDLSGFRTEESRIAFRAVVHAIKDTLKEGDEVRIPGLGSFAFKMAKARKIPARGGTFKLPEMQLPERPVLRFIFEDAARKELRDVQPKRVRKNAKWSNERASRAQAPAGTAAPSSPLDTEPSALRGPDSNSRSQNQSLDAADTFATQDCKLDNTYTPPDERRVLHDPLDRPRE